MKKPNLKSIVSSKAVKGVPSKIHGRGLFCKEKIMKNGLVAKKAGYELTKDEPLIIKPKGHIELQISDDIFLAPNDDSGFEENMIFINHSCSPNVGMCGDREFVAMREIEVGEELTIDYAMIDDSDYVMDCMCGSINCRKKITGRDWILHELHYKYKGYYSDYLAKKIKKLSCEC